MSILFLHVTKISFTICAVNKEGIKAGEGVSFRRKILKGLTVCINLRKGIDKDVTRKLKYH